MQHARAEIPTVHDSSEPEITDWVLVGYRRYIEEDPLAMDRAYLALFCREMGDDRYQFKFRWHDSTYVSVEHEGESIDVEDYFFMGMVFRDNGYGEDIDVLWDGGMKRNNIGGEYETSHSKTITITDWTGIRFTGALMVHVTVTPSYSERMWGHVITLEVGIMTGLAWAASPAAGLAATIAGAAILGWYDEECLQDDDVNLYYHAFFGGLDLLNDMNSCVQIQVFADDGYDLPDIMEGSPAKRKHTGLVDIMVQCAFPSKISMDVFMLTQDPLTGGYADQAETRIDSNIHGDPGIVILDFPESKVALPFDNGERKTIEIEWDLSKQYFSYDGFQNKEFQNHLQSGRFVPLSEQFAYLKSMHVDTWDIPTVQFELKVRVDFELSADMVEDFPANPLHSIYEEQRVVSALDYYSLGHMGSYERVERDNLSDFKVYLGDESIMAVAAAPLIPIVIVSELMKEGGIYVNMPDDLMDVVILPPWSSEVIGEITSDEDPDRRIAFADPERFAQSTIEDVQRAVEQKMPIRSITVPDPWNTIYCIIDPDVVPEGLLFEPPTVTPGGGIYKPIDESVTAWESFLTGNGELYAELTIEEIERRSQFTLRAVPGLPDEDMTVIDIMDPESNYEFGVQLPDGEIIELVSILETEENEQGAVMIRDTLAQVLIPGKVDEENGEYGFVKEFPGWEDGTTISITTAGLSDDSLFMVAMPDPEKSVVVSMRDLGQNEMYDSAVVICVADPDSEITFREVSDLPLQQSSDGNVLHQIVRVKDEQTEVQTYSPSFPIDPLPISESTLFDVAGPTFVDNDPSGTSGLRSVVNIENNAVIFSSAEPPRSEVMRICRKDDQFSDDELALVISKRTTLEDGVLVRGTALFPSDAPMQEIRSWVVSSEVYSYEGMRTRRHYDNYLYSTHIPMGGTSGTVQEFVIHHPGEDGEFFSIGSVDLDGQFMMNSGVEGFIILARSSSDDIFSLSHVELEDVILTTETETQPDGSITLSGMCNRFDGTELMITCDGESGQNYMFETTAMYGGYHVVIESGEIPGGVYYCMVSDDAGNQAGTWIEVPNGVL